jgi:hypothetical protein
MPFILSRPLAPLLLLLLSAGCARDDAGDEGEPLALDALPVWTLELEETFDGEFGRIAALAVDSRDRVYVADAMRQQIDVYGPRAEHLATVGGRGGGPGEFTGLRDLAVGRADSLYALDVQSQRVSIFATDGQLRLAGTLPLTRQGSMANYQILLPAAGGLLVPYTVPATEETADNERRMIYRLVHGTDRADSREVLQIPERDFLVTRDPSFGFSIGSMPYGREPFVRLGPDDLLYYAWSEDLHIRRYNLQGNEISTIQLRVPRAPVQDADVRTLIDSYGSDPFAQIATAQLQRAHSEGRLPRTRPVLKNLLVDEHSRIWVNLLTADDVMMSTPSGMAYRGRDAAATSRWVVLDAEGKPIAAMVVPHALSIRAVRGDRAWGIAMDDLGVERVVRYAVRR